MICQIIKTNRSPVRGNTENGLKGKRRASGFKKTGDFTGLKSRKKRGEQEQSSRKKFRRGVGEWGGTEVSLLGRERKFHAERVLQNNTKGGERKGRDLLARAGKGEQEPGGFKSGGCLSWGSGGDHVVEGKSWKGAKSC